ncbi:phosphatase PAP2 family protein [Rhizobium sp. SG2393]|uniref:phosphatase PAP2 family protein n=1 Tax=Rhizobium sp. SG2393 TaxID=3276279 RepID=UPI00366A5883
MLFLPLERWILIVITLLFCGSCFVLWLDGVAFALDRIGACLIAGAVPIAIGLFYRVSGRSDRIALAAVSTGLFILFTLAGSIFNYVFLPIAFPPIDPFLIRIDAMLGYDWATTVTFAATHPWIGHVLFFVYSSSLLQLVFLNCWFGFRGDATQLHLMMLSGMIAFAFAMVIWVLFPSFGALSYANLPGWVEQTIPVAGGTAYGRELLRIAADGPDVIDPSQMIGLIAFPSFHTVMACMSLAFAPRVLPLRLFFYGLNLLMFPAVLVQGGHHLVDIGGGIAVFLVARMCAERLIVVTQTLRPRFDGRLASRQL